MHLGAHKTATTHFQKGLRRGRAVLEEAGVTVLTPADLRGARPIGVRMGVAFSRGTRRKDWSPELLAGLAAGRPRLVLSEENILGQMSGAEGPHGPALYPEARRRVAALSEAVAPLPLTLCLAIRDPADYLASAWSQSLYGGFGGDFAAFVARIPLHGVDWCALVLRLLEVERVAEVVVWRKEDYPAVAPLAVEAMAGPGLADPAWFDHPALHPGLSARAAAEALKAPAGPKRARAAAAARARHPAGPGAAKFAPFDEELRALAAEFYEAQWRRLGGLPRVRRLVPPGSAGG